MSQNILGRVVCAFSLALLAAGASTALATPVPTPDLMGVDSQTGDVYIINTTNAALTYVGHAAVGTGQLSSLEYSSAGVMWGYTKGINPELYTVNPATGAATFMRNITSSIPGDGTFNLFEGAFVFAPGNPNLAYGLNWNNSSNNRLFQLDLTTGVATKGAKLTGAHDVNGIALRSDGKIIGIDQTNNDIVEITLDFNSANTVTPVVLKHITSFTFGSVGGMTAVGDTGYFSTAGPNGIPAGSNALYKVDLYTGAVTLIGAFNPTPTTLGIGALAIAPEPATLAVLALSSLMFLRRRR